MRIIYNKTYHPFRGRNIFKKQIQNYIFFKIKRKFFGRKENTINLEFKLAIKKWPLITLIDKCKLFRIKHITLLEGETFLRNKNKIEFFVNKVHIFWQKRKHH